jgi:hypothetical protein
MACGVCRDKKVKCKPILRPSTCRDTGNPHIQITSLNVATCLIDYAADMHHCRRPGKAHLRILQSTSPQSPLLLSNSFLSLSAQSKIAAEHASLTVKPLYLDARCIMRTGRADATGQQNRSTTRSATIPRDANTLAPRGGLARDVYKNQTSRVQAPFLIPWHMASYLHIHCLTSGAMTMKLETPFPTIVPMMGY